MKFCPFCESCLTKSTEGEYVQLLCLRCKKTFKGEADDTLIACSFNPLDASGENNSLQKSEISNMLTLAAYDRVNKIVGVPCRTPDCKRLYMILVSTETEGSWYVCDNCNAKFSGSEIDV